MYIHTCKLFNQQTVAGPFHRKHTVSPLRLLTTTYSFNQPADSDTDLSTTNFYSPNSDTDLSTTNFYSPNSPKWAQGSTKCWPV